MPTDQDTSITTTKTLKKKKPSLRGEALQKHQRKNKKRPSQKTIAARRALSELSQKAKLVKQQQLAKAKTETEKLQAAALTINDILISMYQSQTGFKTFRTFNDWKKLGYSVKRDETSFRIWARPKQVTDKVTTEEGKELTSEPWEFWPMCCLFHENQVEKVQERSNPAYTTTECHAKDDLNNGEDTGSKDSVIDPLAVNPQIRNKTQDMGNNESLTRGLFPQNDGTYIAMTYSESKPFRTEKGALVWLAARGIDAMGERIDRPVSEDSNPFVDPHYDSRVDARRERLEERADNKSREADAMHQRARSHTEHIPFGQPILIGHHSERRHRNAIDKAWRDTGKAVELDKYSDTLRSRAAGVGTGGISSSDPEAITKLQDELAERIDAQETMKVVNKIVKKRNLDDDEKVEKIVAANLLSQAQAEQIVQPDFANRIGFADYTLSNNNASIRRINQRIDELTRLRNTQPIDFSNDDFSFSVDDGRVVLEFHDGKPNDAVRKIVKSYSFKWSRYQTAWVRKATANGVGAGKRLCKELQQIDSIYPPNS